MTKFKTQIAEFHASVTPQDNKKIESIYDDLDKSIGKLLYIEIAYNSKVHMEAVELTEEELSRIVDVVKYIISKYDCQGGISYECYMNNF